MSQAIESVCTLCPRRCGANREVKPGFCGEKNEVRIARAALHFWEEPVISGDKGSGAVFFCGCNLHCVYCQNAEISGGLLCAEPKGEAVSIPELSAIFLKLQEQGAHNINLVTPSHYAAQIARALAMAKEEGLNIPVVYNTSSYDSPEELELFHGLVDIYLADFKYWSAQNAADYSHAPDYRAVALKAIECMFEQRGSAKFYDDGIMKSGVIVRHLLLPGCLEDAKKILFHLYGKYRDDIYFSLMHQYTPMPGVPSGLKRPVSRGEYDRLVDYALSLGIENAFIQDEGADKKCFIPDFDGTGVK